MLNQVGWYCKDGSFLSLWGKIILSFKILWWSNHRSSFSRMYPFIVHLDLRLCKSSLCTWAQWLDEFTVPWALWFTMQSRLGTTSTTWAHPIKYLSDSGFLKTLSQSILPTIICKQVCIIMFKTFMEAKIKYLIISHHSNQHQLVTHGVLLPNQKLTFYRII